MAQRTLQENIAINRSAWKGTRDAIRRKGVEVAEGTPVTEFEQKIDAIEIPTPVLQEKSVSITENGQVEVTPDTGFDGLSKVIADVNVAGGGGDTKKVTFFDYDGTVIAEYSLEEAQALTELPAIPEHDKLTATGWTHTLEQVNAAANMLHVGATYRTTSGRTIFKYTLTPVTGLSLTLRLGGNAVYTIYWPDGTSATYSGKQTITKNHEEYGDFEAEINVDAGGTLMLGQGSSSYPFFGNTIYAHALTSIFVGNKTQLDKYALYNALSLCFIVMPKGITHIGENTFSGCHSLRFAILPNGVSAIDVGAFSQNSSLYAAVFPEGLLTIGNNAFNQCFSFRAIILPNSVVNLTRNAFYQCYNVSRVVLSANLTEIPEYAFAECQAIESLPLPNSLLKIYYGAFSGLRSLRSIFIPDGVLSIDGNAFSSVYCATSVRLPSSLISIGSSAFYNARSLKSIIIPENVTSIEASAFGNCMSLIEVVLEGKVPPTIYANSFPTASAIRKYYVPDESVEAYKTATNWATYANYIYPISQKPAA